jgi:hypothetical protein
MRPLCDNYNFIEALFWLLLGLGVLLTGLKKKRWPLGLLLMAFGLSDFVEMRTGAWWRPWWLLVWKGLCLLGLVWFAITWIKQKRKPKINVCEKT